MMAPKVILIEDDEMMLSLLDTLLTLEGYQVVQFREGGLEDLLTVLHEEKPDLALLDVNLRSFSGFDVLESIRCDAGLKDMRVLMSSGLDLSTECIQRGADSFILKPYTPDELIQLMVQGFEA